MGKTIYTLIAALGFMSCNNGTTDEKSNDREIDSRQIRSTEQQMKAIYIEDRSQYDQSFIDGLSEYNKPIRLIDKYIIAGNDTTYFPDDLKQNIKAIFKGASEKNKFVLTVTRTNLTNLDYEFQLLNNANEVTNKKSGKAVLGSMFFLATEGDDDEQMNDGYASEEYWDRSNNCNLSIRIGIGLDSNGKQRAKLQYNCEDKDGQALSLDDCPTLRTE